MGVFNDEDDDKILSNTEEGITIKLPKLAWFTRPKVFIVGFLLGALVLFGVMCKVYNAGAQSAQQTAGTAPSVVFARVQKQNKLVVAAQDYTIVDKYSNSNKIPFTDINIIGTEKKFWYRYTGTLEVSVDLDTADYDQTGDTSATITLDQPYISSNTPDMDESGVLEETNGILNDIKVEDVDAFQKECVKQSEENAEKGGIIEEARNNTQTDLDMLFQTALGEDFKVTIAWRDPAE